MKIKYFTFDGVPKVILTLNNKHIGTYILSTLDGIACLNFDINWCHRQLMFDDVVGVE